MTKTFDKLFELMWYRNLPCFDIHGITSTYKGEAAMLQYCAWKGVPIPCAAIFDPFPTDTGICCSFNMKSAEEIFRKSPYTNIVTKLLARDKSKAFDDEKKPQWYKDAREPKTRPGIK